MRFTNDVNVTVENFENVLGNKVNNQFEITIKRDNGITTNKIFQSYQSTIINIDYINYHVTVGKDWNYSATTGKYRNQFLNNYLPTLADKKSLEKAIKDGRFNTIASEWTISLED